jgi:hypothetical protein
MQRAEKQKRLSVGAGLLLLPLSAAASDFNRAIADFIFVPAHLALGAAALALHMGKSPPRLGFVSGVVLTGLSLVTSLFIWEFRRPKSIALELEIAPETVIIGALILVVPVLLSVGLVVRYWRSRAA